MSETEQWRVKHDPNDSWYQYRIYAEDVLIVNVLAVGSAGKKIAETITADHNTRAALVAENERLRTALAHVGSNHQPTHNRCCDDLRRNVYDYIDAALTAAQEPEAPGKEAINYAVRLLDTADFPELEPTIRRQYWPDDPEAPLPGGRAGEGE